MFATLAVVAALLAAVAEAQCPEGFSALNITTASGNDTRCFRQPAGQHDWLQCRSTCGTLDSTMPCVDSGDVYAALQDEFGVSFWTGLWQDVNGDDEGPDAGWDQQARGGCATGFRFWNSLDNEPGDDFGLYSENCAASSSIAGYGMSDVACDAAGVYCVCEAGSEAVLLTDAEVDWLGDSIYEFVAAGVALGVISCIICCAMCGAGVIGGGMVFGAKPKANHGHVDTVATDYAAKWLSISGVVLIGWDLFWGFVGVGFGSLAAFVGVDYLSAPLSAISMILTVVYAWVLYKALVHRRADACGCCGSFLGAAFVFGVVLFVFRIISMAGSVVSYLVAAADDDLGDNDVYSTLVSLFITLVFSVIGLIINGAAIYFARKLNKAVLAASSAASATATTAGPATATTATPADPSGIRAKRLEDSSDEAGPSGSGAGGSSVSSTSFSATASSSA